MDMNRRSFIQTLMLSAGAVSAAASPFWKQPRSLGLAFKHQPKTRLALELTASEAELAKVFRTASRTLYLFGGPVLARAQSQDTPWMNFLVDCRDFRRLKQRLFEFGVEPVSTPEMPGSFIKFIYGDKVCNVMNCDIDEFCQLNRLNARVQLVPFAHNFLIYDCKRRQLTDPFDSLNVRSSGGRPGIKLVARPRTLVEGFDCVLSGRFEAGLFGFEPSEELRDFDAFILNSSCPSEDVPKIVERVVNYLPDALEKLGHEKAAEIALSPLVREVLKTGLRVGIEEVWSDLLREEPGDRAAEFIALLKDGMGAGRGATGFQDDLTMYMAQHGYALRRSDLAAQVVMNA